MIFQISFEQITIDIFNANFETLNFKHGIYEKKMSPKKEKNSPNFLKKKIQKPIKFSNGYSGLIAKPDSNYIDPFLLNNIFISKITLLTHKVETGNHDKKRGRTEKPYE